MAELAGSLLLMMVALARNAVGLDIAAIAAQLRGVGVQAVNLLQMTSAIDVGGAVTLLALGLHTV